MIVSQWLLRIFMRSG